MFADTEGQTKVMACLVKSHDFCRNAARHLEPKHFSGVIDNNIAKLLLDYYDIYGSPITEFAFKKEFDSSVKLKKIKADDDEVKIYHERFAELLALDVSDDWKFTLSDTIKLIKAREYQKLVEMMTTKWLPKDDFAEIEKHAHRISEISIDSGVEPYDIYSMDAIKARTARRMKEEMYREVGIQTGIKKLDDTLYKGGWFKKNFYLLMAPPKRGKSMALYWFAYQANLQDVDVALFSCENGKEIIEDRYDAMISDIKMMGLSARSLEVAKRLKRKRPPGNLYIFEYPTQTLTCDEIQRQVERLNASGARIGLIEADYLDIMKPPVARTDRLVEEADIGKGLRRLSGIFEVPVISATQVNRPGSDKTIITGKDVRGTWDKIADADCIITFSATPEEMRENILRIHISESRNSPQTTFTIKTSYNLGKFYKEFVEEEL